MQRFARLPVMFWLFFSPIAAAQDDFTTVEIKTTRVAQGIYMLEGRGGNIGVCIGSDGVLIIDDQYAPLAPKIGKAIDALGGKSPKYILNTHWHSDHTGGNEHFGKSGTIIAHENVRKRLSAPQELFGRVVEPLGKDGLPVITFDESLRIHFNGERILAVHFPRAHTDGDSVVFFEGANVVHMGDLMFMGMFPFVDLDHGGDVQGVIDGVTHIIAEIEAWPLEKRSAVKIIPGHGPLCSLDDLRTYQSMLIESRDVVSKAVSAGKSADEIKKEGVPAKWQAWGSGFIKTDRWLETVHKSLTRK